MSEDKEHPSTGIAVLDLGNKSEEKDVVTLDGKVIIDARDKQVPGTSKHWTDRQELDKYSRLVRTVRQIFASSEHYKDISIAQRSELIGSAVLNDLIDLGFTEIQSVQIKGDAHELEHWKPKNRIAMQWVLSPEEWAKKKALLSTDG